MTQAECRPLFECYRLPLLKSGIACCPRKPPSWPTEIGGPLAMKVMSADVIHKYDAGGVLLKVVGADQARAAYAQIHENVQKHVPGAKIQGILIEQMAPKGVEVILGASRDARFGPLMMFGLGGTMVEVLKDVSFRLAPMWQISAERMVRSIKAFKLLDGFRGIPPADVDSIVDTLLAAFPHGLQPSGDFRTGHQPADRACPRARLFGGRQPRDAAQAGFCSCGGHCSSAAK